MFHIESIYSNGLFFNQAMGRINRKYSHLMNMILKYLNTIFVANKDYQKIEIEILIQPEEYKNLESGIRKQSDEYLNSLNKLENLIKKFNKQNGLRLISEEEYENLKPGICKQSDEYLNSLNKLENLIKKYHQ